MNIKNRSFIVFSGLLLFAVLLNITGVTIGDSLLVVVSIPLIFVFLILLYVFSVKKVNLLLLGYQFSILIAEVLYLFKEKYFTLVIVFYTVAQFILVISILNLKHIKLKNSLFYFLLLFFSFVFVYLFVLDIKEGSLFVIIYGFSVCLMVALATANYLKKMYMANYLLFLGAAFVVLSNAIMSLFVFEATTNIPILITNVTAHSFICVSFIVRNDRVLPKTE